MYQKKIIFFAKMFFSSESTQRSFWVSRTDSSSMFLSGPNRAAETDWELSVADLKDPEKNDETDKAKIIIK